MPPVAQRAHNLDAGAAVRPGAAVQHLGPFHDLSLAVAFAAARGDFWRLTGNLRGPLHHSHLPVSMRATNWPHLAQAYVAYTVAMFRRLIGS